MEKLRVKNEHMHSKQIIWDFINKTLTKSQIFVDLPAVLDTGLTANLWKNKACVMPGVDLASGNTVRNNELSFFWYGPKNWPLVQGI